jgi:hypothetical protein
MIFPGFIIHDHADIADALRALQDFRGLSNEELEHLAGLARGHVDKCLGPSRQKSIGKATLNYLLSALGGQLVLMRDLRQEQRMQRRWNGRNGKQIRVVAHGMSRAQIAQAKIIIFKQIADRLSLHRQNIAAVKRSAIARKAAKARWKRRHHGSSAIGNSARPASRAATATPTASR